MHVTVLVSREVCCTAGGQMQCRAPKYALTAGYNVTSLHTSARPVELHGMER
jgi:hypothetical protein